MKYCQVYGASISFYERHSEERLTDCQMRTLGLKNRTIREQYNIRKTVYAAKALCLLSHRPFFDAFKKFLLHVYKISTTGPHTVPLERHISHFMYNVPYPSLKRPHVMVQVCAMVVSDVIILLLFWDGYAGIVTCVQDGVNLITVLVRILPVL